MSGLIYIGWFILVCISMYSVFVFVGMNGLVNMFPEGRRWWQLPAQLTSLVIFGLICAFHPF